MRRRGAALAWLSGFRRLARAGGGGGAPVSVLHPPATSVSDTASPTALAVALTDADGDSLHRQACDGRRCDVETSVTALSLDRETLSFAAVEADALGAVSIDAAFTVVARARAIIAHRQANGPFADVDDLTEVRDIGDCTLESIRGLIEAR